MACGTRQSPVLAWGKSPGASTRRRPQPRFPTTCQQLATVRSPARRENGRVSDYLLSEDPNDLDLERVVRWISTDAYWAKGRAGDVIERSFANSFPVGLYAPDRQQVAVARIVSDRATFAWLCDVYVDPDHRGHGLGTML